MPTPSIRHILIWVAGVPLYHPAVSPAQYSWLVLFAWNLRRWLPGPLASASKATPCVPLHPETWSQSI